MKKYQSGVYRIRDNDEYGFDIEKCIKSFETQYNIDIRKLPQWKEIVHRLHTTTTDFKRKIKEVDKRKKIIIDKLYTQTTRRSPFELTHYYVRTAKKWQALEVKNKKRKAFTNEELLDEFPIVNYETEGEMSSMNATRHESINGTRHPNTEIIPSEDINIFLEEPPTKTEAGTEVNVSELSHLPFFFCTNRHKFVSPLGSRDGALTYNSKIDIMEIEPESDPKEWSTLKQTSLLRSLPEALTITKNILSEQILKFSILNCTTEYLNLRFKCFTDKVRFQIIKLFPHTPLRLYPGIAVSFKISFKLRPNESYEEFASSLYFKVGRNVITKSSAEAFVIPIVSKFMESRSVEASETVYFTPKYSWHINGKCGYPTGVVKVLVKDKYNYHLRVTKRFVDFVKDTVNISEIAIASESIVEREDISDEDIKSNEFTTSKSELLIEIVKSESLKTIDYIGFIVDEIIGLALEPFMFEHTYLNLTPYSKQNITVYFTEAEHTGFHQTYYDLNFCDPDTEKIIITKTVLLLSEVLPHPIQVFPEILDMSDSPITHGFCEDHITVSNTHKIYNATVKFKLTKKMRQLFHITPMEAFVHPRSKVDFVVRMCSREFKYPKKPEDFAHFTIKIIFSGLESIYYNIPPLFYEIIAPCAFEFKTIYNENYFKEVSSKNLVEYTEY